MAINFDEYKKLIFESWVPRNYTGYDYAVFGAPTT